MEFVQEFAVVQGALLTLQKKLGPLKNLTEDNSGTKEKIQTVVNTLLKVLNSFEAADHPEGCIKLRQISLFLVLNSDLKICEVMKEDPNFGHLIETAPTLSNHIMIDMFTTPLLSSYFHELLLYCPPVLSLELLDIAVSKLKQEHSVMPLSCLAICIKAIYVKLLSSQKQTTDHSCEINCSSLKFMDYYSKFLEFLSDPKKINILFENSQCLEKFGEILITSLELVTSCLMLFINPPVVSDDILNIYKINIVFDYDVWHQESDNTIIDLMNEQLLSVLVVQVTHITVDVWLGWAEFDSKFVHNYSLQQYIAESMYKCLKVLQAAMEKGMKSQLFKGLISMLSSMALKPRDEEDEIKDADMNFILNRIPDHSFSRRKWLLALFTKYGDAVAKEECVECINRNIDLIDSEIIFLFMEKIYLLIKNEIENVPETVKGVFLHGVYQLSLEEQLQLLKKFLDEYGVNSHLCSSEYYTKVTKVFNTIVDSTEFSQEKKYVEIVNLCLQNPLDTMKRLLEHCVASNKQAQIMGDIIVMLKPFHSLCVNKNEPEQCSLLVNLLYDIMQKKNDIEFSDTSFVSMVTVLAMNCVIPPDSFLKNNLFPLMHKCLKDSNWQDIILWLETLQVFVDGSVKSENKVDIAAVLLNVAQVMELSRKNLYTFSYAALTACGHAINIISIVFEAYLEVVEDTTLMPLSKCLMNVVSPINIFYFFDLWKKSENYSHLTADRKVYLLHWMYMEKCNIQPPWGSSVDLQRKRIILELAQLLPVCVKTEWQTVVQNLHNLMSPLLGELSSTFVFECLIDAIQIMSVLSSASCLTDKEQECAFSCLDFCIRNLSTIAKEELTGKPETISAKTASILFQKIANLNYLLPGIVKDSCAGILLNMQVDLISKAICDMQMCPDEDEEEKQITKALWNEELRNMAIAIAMINDLKTRQALARKLQEGISQV